MCLKVGLWRIDFIRKKADDFFFVTKVVFFHSTILHFLVQVLRELLIVTKNYAAVTRKPLCQKATKTIHLSGRKKYCTYSGKVLPQKKNSRPKELTTKSCRVEVEWQKKRQSRAFRAWNFSISAILRTNFGFEFSIWTILCRKMVEHFEHKKFSSDHRAILSIILEKIFEQNRAFFEQNQAFFKHDRAEPAVNTKFWQILQ